MQRYDYYMADSDGLVTLGPELTRLMGRLDSRFCEWAMRVEASPMTFPPLMRASDLHNLDYFHSFPHLGLVATPIHPSRCAIIAKNTVNGNIPADHLCDGNYLLPSAACYNVYLHFRGRKVAEAEYITTIARCFRNESHYDGLRRLLGFTMREIVCIGSAEAVQAHLKTFRHMIVEFSKEIGLEISVQAATDPFFSNDNAKLAMQALFPVKEEFVYGGSLAIASINSHRNFFGDRCRISLESGTPAFTGCVAFGLERWLDAILQRHDGDIGVISRILN